MVCQVSLGTILIQNGNLRDLSGLFDSLGTKLTFGAKFKDVFGNYALNFRAYPVKTAINL
jgi:hypothetical protein